jgi:imidazole glycerol-phosphate synthase subunit HisH
MIIILEYGIGNIASISNMLKKAGVQARISGDTADVLAAEKLILPGVGHFDHCMNELRKAPFYEALQQKVLGDKTPLLGVCVGHQMLFDESEEGQAKGLGWIPGQVVKFRQDQMPAGYKIPHMAWTDTKPAEGAVLFERMEDPRFYFVHSYHTQCAAQYIQATASYGCEFVASVNKDNIYGVQFHPEKSHRFGMEVYRNFSNINNTL